MLKTLNCWYNSIPEPWRMMIAIALGAGFLWMLLYTYWAWLPISLILMMRMCYGPKSMKVKVTGDTLNMVRKDDSYEVDFIKEE